MISPRRIESPRRRQLGLAMINRGTLGLTVIVQIGEITVVLPSVEHDKVGKGTELESPPDSQRIVSVDL